MLLNCGVGEDSWESLELQVHPKGDQFWVFIGSTDVEAETPILWPADSKSRLIWKDPDAGKDWRREEKGMTEDEIVGWHHCLKGHEFEQALGVDGQGDLLQSIGSQRVGHDWVTELNRIEDICCIVMWPQIWSKSQKFPWLRFIFYSFFFFDPLAFFFFHIWRIRQWSFSF